MKWCSCKVSLYLRCYLQTCTEAHGGFFPFKFFFFFFFKFNSINPEPIPKENFSDNT